MFPLAMLAGLACASCRVGKSSELREIVLTEPMISMRMDELFALAESLDSKEALWLIEQLTHGDPWVRSKAAMALSGSESRGAAAALYLASLGEEESYVYGCILSSLGRMDQNGKTFLVRLLERRGLSRILVAALAQSSGVNPRKTWRGNYFVTDLRGQQWWHNTGRKELGDRVPEHPKEDHPRGPRGPWKDHTGPPENWNSER